ncbi:MAG: hypothetical protein KAS32_10210 [Candidatus Peribacteraceae bacterium]|nr:hypothetical protein [Candidatus Peribacteraceae bacterium]
MAKRNKNKKSVSTNVTSPKKLEQKTPATAPIEPNVDKDTIEPSPLVSKQEAEIERLQGLLKAAKKTVAATKRQQVGSVKLEKARSYATDATDWALAAKDKSDKATKRALDAIGKLDDYETALGIDEAKRTSTKLIDMTKVLNDATE